MRGPFIGLMSGTSLDGTDAVLLDCSQGIRVLCHAHQPFTPELRDTLLALNTPGENELHRAAIAGAHRHAGAGDAPGAPLERTAGRQHRGHESLSG